MANENIGSTAGESSPQNKRGHSEGEQSRPAPENMKSTVTAAAQDYVRENPMKAVFTALGIGFVLGLIFRGR
jgi:ElaB/YqjD/DUF883 family membrane-anchored ribosome-binding protein